MVACPALLCIAKDFVGADDLSEFQRSIRIARSDVGMNTFDGSAKCGPEILSVITWKSPEQIVKRFHRRSRCRISSSPSEIPRANLLRSTRSTEFHRMRRMLVQ